MNYLNGKISVVLVNVPSNLNQISLTIVAKRFGQTSNVIKNVTIKIAEVDKELEPYLKELGLK